MLKHKNPILISAIILALILGGGYLIWQHNINKHREQAPQPEAADMYEYQEEPASSEDSMNIYPVRESSSNGVETYISSKYGFSFKYPKGFIVTNFQEGEYGETILVQSSASNQRSNQRQTSGFQIFISPFDEPGPLTKERILEDLPDMVIENPEQRLLKNGAPGLIFFSEEASLGKTREVWFIYPVRSSDSNGVNDGYLYQISTYAELDKWLAEILSTWRFQE